MVIIYGFIAIISVVMIIIAEGIGLKILYAILLAMSLFLIIYFRKRKKAEK